MKKKHDRQHPPLKASPNDDRLSSSKTEGEGARRGADADGYVMKIVSKYLREVPPPKVDITGL